MLGPYCFIVSCLPIGFCQLSLINEYCIIPDNFEKTVWPPKLKTCRRLCAQCACMRACMCACMRVCGLTSRWSLHLRQRLRSLQFLRVIRDFLLPISLLSLDAVSGVNLLKNVAHCSDVILRAHLLHLPIVIPACTDWQSHIQQLIKVPPSPIQLSIPNSISIGSAVFAQLTAHVRSNAINAPLKTLIAAINAVKK